MPNQDLALSSIVACRSRRCIKRHQAFSYLSPSTAAAERYIRAEVAAQEYECTKRLVNEPLKHRPTYDLLKESFDMLNFESLNGASGAGYNPNNAKASMPYKYKSARKNHTYTSALNSRHRSHSRERLTIRATSTRLACFSVPQSYCQVRELSPRRPLNETPVQNKRKILNA